jgi:transcriptional regulator with XRE-family HTH domain
MDTTRTTGIPPASSAEEHQQAGPTVLRMLVGAQLRKLREARNITAKQAGFEIRGSHSKISRLEGGRTTFKPRDVADLLTLYGVHCESERATLLALAIQANAPGWWHDYADVIDQWFEPYLGLEQDASVIRTFEVQFIPGLLQTREYARAVISLNREEALDDEVERRVTVRCKRQELLRHLDPPRLWTVIDEAALRRWIGSPAIQCAQLEHLLEIAELPAVTIVALPFSGGGHAAAGGSITILRFPQDGIPDVVYLEQLAGAIYLDKPAESDRYWHVMNRLAVEASSAADTTKLLYRILKEMRGASR